MKKSKIVKCIDCGREFPRKELNRKFRCKDCRPNALFTTIDQLMHHQGPEYEKWKQGIRASIDKLQD